VRNFRPSEKARLRPALTGIMFPLRGLQFFPSLVPTSVLTRTPDSSIADVARTLNVRELKRGIH